MSLWRADNPSNAYLRSKQFMYVLRPAYACFEYPELRNEQFFYRWVSKSPDYKLNAVASSMDYLRELLNSPEREAVLLRPTDGRQMITHRLDQIPVEAWGSPHAFWGGLRFLSSNGVRRILSETHAGCWRIETLIPTYETGPELGRGLVSAPMTQDEVRELVRRRGWLILLDGSRPVSPDDTVNSYALTRFE